MLLDQLTICGPGLIGGSIALAARRAGLAQHIVAIDRQGGAKYEASLRAQVADTWLATRERDAVISAYKSSSLVLLCTPVASIVDELPSALEHAAVVSDAGSTKGAICQAASLHPRRSRFVPSHPMAGNPEGGLHHARADLFDQRRWLLCPDGADADALALLRDFALGLGAQVVEVSASHHDHAVALTSHLPQVLASALAVLAHEQNAELAAGPGFASATRVAGGSETIWRDIFSTNHVAVGQSLQSLAELLAELGSSMEKGDVQPTLELLAAARALRCRQL